MIDFPYALDWKSTAFALIGNSAGAGFGLSGASITVSSNSGHWSADASFVIRSEDQYFGWQGFVAEMRGVIGTTLVPCKARYLPFDAQGRRMTGKAAVDFGGTSVWDTVGLEQTGVVHAQLETDGTLRDSEIAVRYVDTTGLRPGHFLSIGDNLHRVVSAYEVATDVFNVQIEPLLRRDFLAGSRVVIDKPHCAMRFVDPGQGVIDQTFSKMQSVSVSFVEAIT